MRKLIDLRLFAILWVWLMGLCGSTPIMAQFDEPSRNQWIIDVAYGFGGPVTVPELSYDGYSVETLRDDYDSSTMSKALSISFGVNHRLFHNFYAGVRIGYKYYNYGVSVSIDNKNSWHLDKYGEVNLNFHMATLPIEIGYNHTYSSKNGFNIYVAATPGYCFSSGVSNRSGEGVFGRYFSMSNPDLCIDGSVGLRYFFNHVYAGFAGHFPITESQKHVSGNTYELSLGCKF